MNAIALIKNLPLTSTRPTLIQQIITANLAFYGLYTLSSGPSKVRLSRDLTL
jgi:membrane associated rhomboid family serine protease